MKADAIKPPKRLTGDAAKKFKELVSLLTERGTVLQQSDADRFAEYADAFVLRARAVKELEGQPLILRGPNGAAYTNPLTKVIKQAEATMHRISAMYGLDLKSRSSTKDEMGGRKREPEVFQWLREHGGLPKQCRVDGIPPENG